ncbi:UNVERIFIED_CONTAM: hypothetical protein NCL1_63864 [Trichonephila clavipes]
MWFTVYNYLDFKSSPVLLVNSGDTTVCRHLWKHSWFKRTITTRGHETTPLRVKEDIDDVSSELGNGGYRLHFLDETFRTQLLSVS